MIEEDDLITAECFEGANEEVHRAEENERIEMMMGQSRQFEEEKKRLQDEFGLKFQQVRQSEYRKMDELKSKQANLVKEL